MEGVSLADAIEAFGRGFTCTRSFTHPYEFARVGSVFVLRDAPRRSGHDRSREILVHGVHPSEALAEIDMAAEGKRYAVCAIEPAEIDSKPIAAAYKAAGYRLARTEAMMVRSCLDVTAVDGPAQISRISDPAAAEEVARVAGTRLVLPEHLEFDDAEVRLYAARLEGEVAGWVRSVRTGSANTWVASMLVRPEFRRRGVGTSLMTSMLADDARLGYRHSVLLASHAGERLYATLGYAKIGLLQLFTPKR